MQIHELPVGSIGDTNKLPFDTGANTYSVSFANLATYIRDKLNSLTFSSLNTSSKTLPGAINEIRPNKGLGNGDIDSLRQSGFYWMQKSNTTGIQPGYDYYMLIVCNTSYNNITLQIAYNMKSSVHKVRMYALNSWSEWA